MDSVDPASPLLGNTVALPDAGTKGAALQTQNRVLQSCLECLDSAVFSVDKQYCYTSFNGVHAAIMKSLYGAEIELGKSLLEYQTVAEDRAKAKANLDRALAGESITETAFSGDDPASRGFFQVTHHPLQNAQGACEGVVVIVKDISKRKQAEEAFQESEARYQTLFEQVGVGIGEVDSTSGRYLQVNQRYCDIVGYSKEELLESSFQPLTHPEDLAASLALMAEIRAGRIHNAALEKRYIRRDGQIIWVSLQIARENPDRSDSTRHVSVVQDITEQKRSEAAIKNQLEELRRWQEVTLGRESRILALKQEVNELRARQGLSLKYGRARRDETEEPPDSGGSGQELTP